MLVQEMPGPLSTLTGDYTLDLTGAMAEATYYGDYYGTGGGNWMINIEPSGDTGDALAVDFAVEGLDYSAGIPTGTYTAAATKWRLSVWNMVSELCRRGAGRLCSCNFR